MTDISIGPDKWCSWIPPTIAVWSTVVVFLYQYSSADYGLDSMRAFYSNRYILIAALYMVYLPGILFWFVDRSRVRDV